VPEDDAGPGFERVGGQMAWAGVARLDPARIAEVAGLPQDYDLQSTLLRMAVQARAVQILLPTDAIRSGHGIEREARTLEERGRAVLATIVSGRSGWFDRYVLAPIARLALPMLVDRNVAGTAVGGGAVGVALVGLVAMGFGWLTTGLVLASVAGIGLAMGAVLSGLRDDEAVAVVQTRGIGIVCALAVLVFAYFTTGYSGDNTMLAVATALVAIAALGERAIVERERRLWWGSAPAYLLVVTLFELIGFPLAGLAAAAAYATVTLAAAIERLRLQP